jgi:ubiquinone/menaquinone biosynthesis C-methylase UbiE
LAIDESSPAHLTVPELRDVYSRIASLYGIWEMLGRGELRRLALQVSEPLSIGKVLEIGSGPGLDLLELARYNRTGFTVGADLTSAMLEIACRHVTNTASDDTAALNRPVLSQCDARALPFKDATFNLIYSAYMLDSLAVPDAEQSLAEMRRVLQPGGYVTLLHLSAEHAWFNLLWGSLCWVVPNLMGGCRPIRIARHLEQAGFTVRQVLRKSQWGVPVEAIIAVRQ